MKNKLPPAHIRLAIMSRDYVISRAIHAVANLGVADHMSDKPIPLKELAELTSTIPELLGRVLDLLTAYGLFKKTENKYALTALSYPLKADDPYSIKDILAMVDESWWQAFAHLETGLKSGIPAFNHQHGTDFFNFLNNNNNKKTQFEKGKTQLSAYDDQAIIQSFNFGQFESLVYFDGKKTNLSTTLATQYPNLTIAHVNLNQLLMQNNKIPSADAYLFKGILHDYEEEKISTILNNCRQQMNKKSSLIIAEQVVPENNLPDTNRTMDVIMMVLVGGRQRTVTQWKKLIELAGFKLIETYSSQGVFTIMNYLPI